MASNTDTSLDEKVKEYKANGDPPEARGYTSSESGASDVWDVDSDHPNFGYQESGASFWDVKEGKEDLNVTVSTWDDEQEAVKSVQPEKKGAYHEDEADEAQRVNKNKRLFCKYASIESKRIRISLDQASHSRCFSGDLI